MIGYTAYDLFASILPGGLVLFVAFFGYFGWPFKEPGATGLVGVLAAAFVVGQANAALAGFLEPLLWWKMPRFGPAPRQDSTWGLFGSSGIYKEDERADIERDFHERVGEGSFQTVFNLGCTRLQQEGKDSFIQRINDQIGFYRNMTFAAVAALAVEVGYASTHRTPLPGMPWIPLLVLGVLLFRYRYRRFWVRFADHVIRGVRTLPLKA